MVNIDSKRQGVFASRRTRRTTKGVRRPTGRCASGLNVFCACWRATTACGLSHSADPRGLRQGARVAARTRGQGSPCRRIVAVARRAICQHSRSSSTANNVCPKLSRANPAAPFVAEKDLFVCERNRCTAKVSEWCGPSPRLPRRSVARAECAGQRSSRE